mgnify:CR=1 FL=1
MSPTLFDDFRDRRSIAERFAEFDAAHPEVYAAFAKFAAQMRARGYTHYSADGIMHIVRYHAAVNPERDGGFASTTILSPCTRGSWSRRIRALRVSSRSGSGGRHEQR